MNSETESSVISKRDNSIHILYKSMLQGMEDVNREMNAVVTNLESIVENCVGLEKHLGPLINSLPKSIDFKEINATRNKD